MALNNNGNKRFDRTLHDANDPGSRRKIIEHLTLCGYECSENPDKYGIDVIATKNGETYLVEVERKKRWSGPHFQYGDVQIPYRKKKFKDTEGNVIFVVFNREMTHFCVTPSASLLDENVRPVRNIYSGAEFENFFFVPVGEFKWATWGQPDDGDLLNFATANIN